MRSGQSRRRALAASSAAGSSRPTATRQLAEQAGEAGVLRRDEIGYARVEMPPAKPTDDVAKKVRALAKLADELEAGASFEITKLTVLKALCAERRPRVRFAHRLATLAERALLGPKSPSSSLTDQRLDEFCATVAAAVEALERYAKRPSADPPQSLRDLLGALRELQNETKRVYGGPVRIVEDRNTVAVEYAVRAAISDHDGGFWAYRAARAYAARWSSRTGRELGEASAPMVREIAEFWCEYYFGKRLDEWLADVPKPKRRSRPKPKAPSTAGRRLKPSPPGSFAAKYPKLAEWITNGGWIEIGYNDGFSPSYARVLEGGGMIWEGEMADFDSVDDVLEAMEAAVRDFE
jgi:hypothetical protein